MAMNNKYDFVPEEIDTRNQPIIRSLHDIYRTRPQDAQSLAKGEERLLASLQQSQVIRAFPTALEPQHPVGQEATAHQKRNAWQHYLSTLAAAAVIVLMVGSLGAVLALVHRSGGSTPKKTPVATASPAIRNRPLPHTVFFQSIKMIDASTGWAASNADALYRTTDGGTHWKNVTPPYNVWGGETFVSADVAWVLTSDGNAHMSIARTVNGGQTWQNMHLTYPQVTDSSLSLHIDALNAQDCWLYSESYLLRTTDGGKTWQTLLTPQASNAPLLYIGWMSFKDSLTGWAQGANKKDASWAMFVTHDGGKTWQTQIFAFSLQLHQNQAQLESPQFFNADDGVLPVTVQVGQSQRTDFYTTHDGGATWSKSAQLQGTSISHTPFADTDFLDMNHWFVVDIKLTGYPFPLSTVVHVTGDGGQSWTTIYPQSAYHNVYGLQFLTGQVGWAISDATPYALIGPDNGVLMKTADGGKSWTPVYIPPPK
jgi:photosystem II stability/assembly factor-like uncharacterized protein